MPTFGVVIDHLPKRMPGRLDYDELALPDGDGITISDKTIEPENFRRFGSRTSDDRTIFTLQGRNSFDMVGMVVSNENVGKRPTRRPSASRIGFASGASMAAVRPVATSWTR